MTKVLYAGLLRYVWTALWLMTHNAFPRYRIFGGLFKFGHGLCMQILCDSYYYVNKTKDKLS